MSASHRLAKMEVHVLSLATCEQISIACPCADVVLDGMARFACHTATLWEWSLWRANVYQGYPASH
jgi:hypothetical protein